MNSNRVTQLDFDQLIYMLEPQEKTPTAKARGGAAIIPINDFIEIKKTIETACQHVKCKQEIVEKYINNVDKSIKKSLDYVTNPGPK